MTKKVTRIYLPLKWSGDWANVRRKPFICSEAVDELWNIPTETYQITLCISPATYDPSTTTYTKCHPE